MLAISFFLSIVADMSPPTSEAVPLLGELRKFEASVTMIKEA
jgi:hypothetical protein